LRIEHSHERDGIRYRELWQERKRYPAKPLRRTRAPVAAPDPDNVLAPLDDECAAMAERVLRAGIRGRRRWSTLRSRSGPSFSPVVVETELLDDLCRNAGLVVEDVWRAERWVIDAFAVEPSMRAWLGLIDPEALRAELEDELQGRPTLLCALAAGPPQGIDWRSFAFVLRAAERVLDLREHGLKAGQRELAGMVDHTKAWTPRRKELLADLLEERFESLVAILDRQLGVRGPISHPEGGLWASAVSEVDLSITDHIKGVLLVENLETFRTLAVLAEQGWLVLQVPGGPPPAECQLIERIAALVPGIRFYVAFDLDPAGIRIARLLQDRTGIVINVDGMSPTLLSRGTRALDLSDWDREQLRRMEGRAGPLEELRAALYSKEYKIEQETIQQRLLALFSENPQWVPK
jgi:uncharacterized protein DUF2399